MSSTLKLVYFVNFGHFGQKRPPPPAEFRGRQQCKGRHQRIKATAIVSTVGIFAFCAKAATTATGRVPKKKYLRLQFVGGATKNCRKKFSDTRGEKVSRRM